MSAIPGACTWIAGMCATGHSGTISPSYARHCQPYLAVLARINAMQATFRNLTVQTLDKNHLVEVSTTLASKVNHADNFKPDVIIGIRSGGYVVAEAMKSSFPEAALF